MVRGRNGLATAGDVSGVLVLLVTGRTEQGSAVGCDSPVCQDEVLATEALGAGGQQAAALWLLFVTVCSLSPAGGPAAAGPGGGDGAGHPRAGEGSQPESHGWLSLAPVPPLARCLQFGCHWRPSVVRVSGATAARGGC